MLLELQTFDEPLKKLKKQKRFTDSWLNHSVIGNMLASNGSASTDPLILASRLASVALQALTHDRFV